MANLCFYNTMNLLTGNYENNGEILTNMFDIIWKEPNPHWIANNSSHIYKHTCTYTQTQLKVWKKIYKRMRDYECIYLPQILTLKIS